jgi:hypothetical protein
MTTSTNPAIFYRFPSNYKTLSYIDDDITKNIQNIYENNFKYQFEDAKEHDFGPYAGDNAWTLGLQYYDLSSYSNINIDNLPTHNSDDIPKIRVINQYAFNIQSNDPTHILLHNRQAFYSVLQHRTNKNGSVHTILNDLILIYKTLKTILGEEHELVRKYLRLYIDFDYIIVRKPEGNNQLNPLEKKNWIDFPSILKIRDTLEQEWRELLNDKSKYKHTKATEFAAWKKHYLMLLLSSLTLTPPTRRELFNIQFTPGHDHDYILIPKNTNKPVQYVLNTTKKGHGFVKYDVGYDTASTNKLSQLIRESYQLYPRTYVFPCMSDITKPAKEATIAKYLKNQICKDIVIKIDNLRSSYITWRNQNKNYTYNERKDDARRMKNNIDVQLHYYNKIEDAVAPFTHNTDSPAATNEPPPNAILLNNNPVSECVTIKIDTDKLLKSPQQKHAEARMKAYRLNPEKEKESFRQYYKDNEFIIKLKRALLRYQNGSQPTKTSIDKFQLYKEDNVWKTKIEF